MMGGNVEDKERERNWSKVAVAAHMSRCPSRHRPTPSTKRYLLHDAGSGVCGVREAGGRGGMYERKMSRMINDEGRWGPVPLRARVRRGEVARASKMY